VLGFGEQWLEGHMHQVTGSHFAISSHSSWGKNSYMAKREPEPGPLLRFEDGCSLTRQRLVSSLQVLLQRVGIELRPKLQN